MAAAVTPQPGAAFEVLVGGEAVVAVPPNPSGGFITNPASAEDQGLDAPEPLIINPVVGAGLVGNGTNFTLYPGASWPIIPGQTTPTSVNAASDGHKFSVVYWP